MEYNSFSKLDSIDRPFDSNDKIQGFVEYSTLYSSNGQPYQKAHYGTGIKEPTWVGIPFRSTCYEKMCPLEQKGVKNLPVSYYPIFKEFDRGMWIYKHSNNAYKDIRNVGKLK
jgi:hypothetical protein